MTAHVCSYPSCLCATSNSLCAFSWIYTCLHPIFTAWIRSTGKVMFSQVFVCSQGGMSLPNMHHWLHDKGNLPSWGSASWQGSLPCWGWGKGSDSWRRFCLLAGGPLAEIRSTGRRYASYWNAYLFPLPLLVPFTPSCGLFHLAPYTFTPTCGPVVSSLHCMFYVNILINLHVSLNILINS